MLWRQFISVCSDHFINVNCPVDGSNGTVFIRLVRKAGIPGAENPCRDASDAG